MGPHKEEADRCHQWITTKYLEGQSDVSVVFDDNYVEEEEGCDSTSWEPMVNEVADDSCME